MSDRIAGGWLSDPAAQFWTHVQLVDGHELWTAKLDKNGYGHVDGKTRLAQRLGETRAHRIAWVLRHGPIPEGRLIGHTCRYRHCLRHIKLTDRAENSLENHARNGRDVCPNGHPRTPENTYIRPDDGYRRCRVCVRERVREYASRQRSTSS